VLEKERFITSFVDRQGLGEGYAKNDLEGYEKNNGIVSFCCKYNELRGNVG
jgi:hypothetical protein